MRATAIPLFVVISLASGIANAQGVNAPPAPATAVTGNWVISETSSPVDYTPIVVAVTTSRGGAENSMLQLNIYCRNGRTELVIAGQAISGRGEDYAITYRVNGDEPVQTAAGPPSFGTGARFKGDVVRLLRSLPDEGDIVIRLAPRTGAPLEGNFSLGGLKPVRDKLAGACKWPQAIAKPHN
jgi:hypothetical protein